MGEQELQEYVTFHVTARDGSDVELAVVDEFDYDHKHYVASCVVKEDEIINENEIYIYRCIVKEDDFEVEQITDADLYEQIAEAYLSMNENA